MKKGELVLKTGERFSGKMPSWQEKSVSGEVVFTTGMCGYVESLTDPSFTGQILVFTYPLIGNYGAPLKEKWESQKIHPKAVVMTRLAPHFSHHGGAKSLLKWLKEQNVPLLTGVDTRALTLQLREKGVTLGTLAPLNAGPCPSQQPSSHWVDQVSPKTPKVMGKGKKRVIVVDCGMKQSILKELLRFDIEILRVPHNFDYSKEPCDGLFLSNGPGDPEACQQSLQILEKAMQNSKPIFGICLGSQLMALAAGAKTYKLKFGHRGQNQPCMDVATKRCYITSQNHGYAIDPKSLQQGWRVTFTNINDGSVEGIAHESKPFFAVQFHPEAAPGPSDTRFLFERFYQCL